MVANLLWLTSDQPYSGHLLECILLYHCYHDYDKVVLWGWKVGSVKKRFRRCDSPSQWLPELCFNATARSSSHTWLVAGLPQKMNCSTPLQMGVSQIGWPLESPIDHIKRTGMMPGGPLFDPPNWNGEVATCSIHSHFPGELFHNLWEHGQPLAYSAWLTRVLARATIEPLVLLMERYLPST